MKSTKKTKKAKKTKKTKRRSPVKRRRNLRGDGPLSFDPPARDGMPPTAKQTKRAAKQRIHASINRVVAECDKVDAALFEFARATQHRDLPPLAIQPIETGDGEVGTGAWAVVSGDPQRPLTETQAQDIVATMQSLAAPAPTSIAAE